MMLTSEAVWGMVAFATMSAAMVSGGVLAARQSQRPPETGAWQGIPGVQPVGSPDIPPTSP